MHRMLSETDVSRAVDCEMRRAASLDRLTVDLDTAYRAAFANDPAARFGDEVARREAERATFATLPDPADFAWHLSERVVEGLLTSFNSKLTGWRVADEYVAEMRPLGLVEYGGPGLGAFGFAVRRVLIKGGC